MKEKKKKKKKTSSSLASYSFLDSTLFSSKLLLLLLPPPRLVCRQTDSADQPFGTQSSIYLITFIISSVIIPAAFLTSDAITGLPESHAI